MNFFHNLIGFFCTSIPAFLLDNLPDPSAIEAWGFKGFLLMAVFFLVNVVRSLLNSHKKEISECHSKQQDKMQQCLDKNSQALDKMSDTLDKQVDYFQTVTKTIVDKQVNSK